MTKFLMPKLLVEILKYGLIGVVNTAITLVIIFSLIYWCGFSALSANAIGYAVGFCCSYILNRVWTFRSQAPVRSSVGRYVVAALFAYGMNFSAVKLGLGLGLSEYRVQLVGAVVYTVCLFIISRLWVFRGVGKRGER